MSHAMTLSLLVEELQARASVTVFGGIVYGNLNNWSLAESMYDLSNRLMTRVITCDETGYTLNLYGNALYYNDKYEEALKIYTQQRDACETINGTDSREYHWTQYCIANIFAVMGKIDEGAAIYKDVIVLYV